MGSQIERSTCSTCHAEILWCVTESGKKMPLNASQHHFFLLGQDGIARVVKVHVSHFATCAQADQHRKPRDGGKETAAK